MEQLNKINKNITVIMIAHRLSSIKKCDSIILLEKGKIKEQGTYEELLEKSNYFREAARKI